MATNFKYDVCVIGGAGHVGLPLSIALADKGQKVVIQDINQNAFTPINQGKMPFLDRGAEAALGRVIHKTLSATTDITVVGEARFVIVVIGTPVDEHLNPELRSLHRLSEELGPHLRSEQVVVLRSTLYPGTTERFRAILKRFNSDVEVCFCPERIAQGKALEELHSLPQIVSGFDIKAIEQVSSLFRLLTEDIVTLAPLEAELTKLFTNSYRYIQFAIANQFYMIAGDYGVDFHKIYDAIVPPLEGVHRLEASEPGAGPEPETRRRLLGTVLRARGSLGDGAFEGEASQQKFDVLTEHERRLPVGVG